MSSPAAKIHPLALRDMASDDAAQWLRSHLSPNAHLSSDSRSLAYGDGFLARSGAKTKPADHIAGAIAAGASALLIEDNTIGQAQPDESAPVPCLRVPRLGDRMGMIASAFYQRPSMRLQLIAVTGTNGKSTVTAALGFALARSGISCAVIGTLGYTVFPAYCAADHEPLWDAQSTGGLTTPDPVTLQKLLSQLADQGVAAVALEASSIGIEQGRLAGCSIKVAAFTNLSHDHLELHGSMDQYARAKSLLFESLSLGAIVINTDDGRAPMMWRACEQPVRRIAIGSQPPSNADAVICAARFVPDEKGWRLGLSGSGKAQGLTTEVMLPAHGQHNIENALVVAGCLLAMKLEDAEIIRRLSEFRLPPGRLQMIGGEHAPLACVDYAHSPDALMRVLEALRPIADARKGRLICLFGCGGNRDSAKRPLMGEIAARIADQVIVTSDNPRDEPAGLIMDEIISGVPEGLRVKVRPIEARDQAIADAMAQAASADVILIAGKGHESIQQIGAAMLAFSDAEHARTAVDRWMQTHQKEGAHA